MAYKISVKKKKEEKETNKTQTLNPTMNKTSAQLPQESIFPIFLEPKMTRINY